ncbi:MAG: hypothetical protein OEV44_07770 [Spirochaetota bacterium]|nr:hypothetical protein [Spirochaetota bacterium]
MDITSKGTQANHPGNPIKSFSNLSSSGKFNLSTLILFISMVVLAICLIVWIALIIYIRSIDTKIAQSKQSLIDINEEIDKEKQKAQEIAYFQKALSKVNDLLSSHIYNSNILNLVERNTLANVQWNSLAADAIKGTIILNGRAKSNSDVAKQIVVLKLIEIDKDAAKNDIYLGLKYKIEQSQNPDINKQIQEALDSLQNAGFEEGKIFKNVFITGISNSINEEGGISFTINATFDPQELIIPYPYNSM